MKTSLKLFEQLHEKNLLPLRGDLVIVEELPLKELKSSSGIIMPETENRFDERPLYVRVVSVGEGEEDENGKLIPLPFKVGNVLQVGTLATVRWCSQFLGLVANTSELRIGIMSGTEEAFITWTDEAQFEEAYQVAQEWKEV